MEVRNLDVKAKTGCDEMTEIKFQLLMELLKNELRPFPNHFLKEI
jgi:hypothetical protein